ncbi:MAG: SMP-30/gluconolactonase/LRE family protein [Verrucomicrobiota bacterium]
MKKPEAIGSRVSRWGEGPVWWEDSLLYVDIESHEVVLLDPASGTERSCPVGERVGFAIPCESGRLICGGDNGLFYLDFDSGTKTLIIDPEPNLPNNRFNDAKVSPDGRLFAGTIALDKTKGAARLYRLDPDQKLTEAYGPVTNSNGTAWTADGSTVYYIDTPSKEVKAFDYDHGTGELSRVRVVIDTKDEPSSPDGMTIDSEGMLWIAFCHGARVTRFDPATGREIARIEVPAYETTSCTFGGPTGHDLYITTGIKADREGDQGGKIFVVRDLPVGGAAVVPFKDKG